MRRLLIIAIVAVSTTASVASARAEDCGGCRNNGGIWDESARLCLPASIPGFDAASYSDIQRVDLKKYRNTVVAGYNQPRLRLAITAYIYDRETPTNEGDEKELRDAIQEILGSHESAKLETGGKGALPLADKPTESSGGLFTWHENGHDYASFLWVLLRDSRYLKLRATYIRPHGGEGEAMKQVIESVHQLARFACVAE